MLIEHEVDVNAPDEDGYSALHIAARRGHSRVVEMLMTWNANVHLVGRKGWTAVHHAAHGGFTGRDACHFR